MSKGEGIVVYCTRGNVMFSSTGELMQGTQNVRKHRINKSIIHNEFQELKDLEKDEFWKNLLNRFSKNIFPKDFKYVDNTLYFKPNTKKHRAECFIDKEDLIESLVRFKEFMRNRGYISNQEKSEINEIITNNTEEKIIISTWKDILRNKEYHIKNFIVEMADKNSLNYEETVNLESTILMGISSEFFNEDNIIIENEKIKEIENLIWDEENRKFSIKIEEIKIKRKTEKINNKKIYTSYTVETSNDNYITLYHEAKDMCIEKKWFKFLETVSMKRR